MNAPTVYATYYTGPGGRGMDRAAEKFKAEGQPISVLVSYVSLASFEKECRPHLYESIFLDSGAFSAANSGKEVRLTDYIAVCHRLMKEWPNLDAIAGLDVIGDHESTTRNVDRMLEAGVPAIPTFHYGSPEKELIEMADRFDHIALGGVVGQAAKPILKWAEQCFARVWPKRIHGFGMAGRSLVTGLPFWSTDSTSMLMGLAKFRQPHYATKGRVQIHANERDYESELRKHLELERFSRHRWREAMKEVQ